MRPYLLTLVLLSSVLLFLHLGARPLLSSGEARASQIAVEMMQRRNLVIPYLNEELLLTKPPLFHWTIILSYKLFGVSEFASRLPSALAGILVVILVYLFGRGFWDRETGFIAGLLLLTSSLFFWSARCARIDSLLLLLITMSLYCFWRGWYLGWFFFMGLGVLSKGPVGVVIPLGTGLLYSFIVKKVKTIHWFWGIVVFFCVAAPWFIAIYFLAPQDKTEMVFVKQNLDWLIGGGDWYKGYVYIAYLFLGFFPWSLGLPFIWKKRDEKKIFLWIWAILVFFIFAFTGKKVSRYILPLYPAISLLTANMICSRKGIRRLYLFTIPVTIVYIALIMFIIYFIPFERARYSPIPFCNMLKEVVPEGVEVYAYMSWDNTIRYYFGRHVSVLEEEGELPRFLDSTKKAYCIMWEKVYERLPREVKERIFVIKTGYNVLEHKTMLVSNRP